MLNTSFIPPLIIQEEVSTIKKKKKKKNAINTLCLLLQVVKKEPYLLQEKGWGEFDLRALLHFTNNLAAPKIIVFDLNFAQPNYSVVEKIEFPNASAELVHLLSMKPSSPTSALSPPTRTNAAHHRPVPRSSMSSNTNRHPSSIPKQSSNYASSSSSRVPSPSRSIHAPRRSSTSSKEAPMSGKSVPPNKMISSKGSSPSLSSSDPSPRASKTPIRKPSSSGKMPLSSRNESFVNRSASDKPKLSSRHIDYEKSHDNPASRSNMARKRDDSPETRRSSSKSSSSSSSRSVRATESSNKPTRTAESASSKYSRAESYPKTSRSIESSSTKPLRPSESSSAKSVRNGESSSTLKSSRTVESSSAKSVRHSETSTPKSSRAPEPSSSKSVRNMESSTIKPTRSFESSSMKSGRTQETSTSKISRNPESSRIPESPKVRSVRTDDPTLKPTRTMELSNKTSRAESSKTTNIYSRPHPYNQNTQYVSSKLQETHTPTAGQENNTQIRDIVRHPQDISNIHLIHSNETSAQMRTAWDIPNINMAQLTWRIASLKSQDRIEMQELIVANETEGMQFFIQENGSVGFNLYSFSSQLLQALWDLTEEVPYVRAAERAVFHDTQMISERSNMESNDSEDPIRETNKVFRTVRRDLHPTEEMSRPEVRSEMRRETPHVRRTDTSPRRTHREENRKRLRDDRDESPRRKVQREDSNRKRQYRA
ncbi:unnamed protein product [Rhizopus stolonifer]